MTKAYRKNSLHEGGYLTINQLEQCGLKEERRCPLCVSMEWLRREMWRERERGSYDSFLIGKVGKWKTKGQQGKRV